VSAGVSRTVILMSDALLKRIARLRVPLGFVLGAAALWLARPTSSSLLLGGPVAVAGNRCGSGPPAIWRRAAK